MEGINVVRGWFLLLTATAVVLKNARLRWRLPVPAQPFHVPSVLLGGPAGTTVALRDAKGRRNWSRRSVVGEAVRGRLRSYTLRDQPPHFQDPFKPRLPDTQGVTGHNVL
jgi:hypothetical protein